jgi:hypothetical protein
LAELPFFELQSIMFMFHLLDLDLHWRARWLPTPGPFPFAAWSEAANDQGGMPQNVQAAFPVAVLTVRPTSMPTMSLRSAPSFRSRLLMLLGAAATPAAGSFRFFAVF